MKNMIEKTKLDGVTILNGSNPMDIGSCAEGFMYALTPSTAKKGRAYYTDKHVSLTSWEKKLPGVVVCQNRGMLFSSCRRIKGGYVIPDIDEINLIVVDEKSEKLCPVDTADAKIAWVGKGEHSVKEVGYDGAGQHWFVTEEGALAIDLWFKTAKGFYGLKGVVEPGLATDVGCEVVDHWGVKRKITLGNTLLINSSMIKGLGAYASLEELKAHSKEWGLDKLQAQWQSGDHLPTGHRPMGTQPNSGNLQLTDEEIESLLKPEALQVWADKFERCAWTHMANVRTARGRAYAARPELMYKDLVMHQIDTKAGNKARRLAQSKFSAKGAYLKLFPDKLAYSLMYVHGMSRNEAAKQAASTGLHGEVRVNPAFAGRYYYTDENGERQLGYKEETHVDSKGRYIEAALVRYPHGAPSETIIVKLYLDETIPADVIVMPLPVADDNGTIPAKDLLCLRLQGADFDGDAVTAYIEKVWLNAQRRNEGKPYMVIPVNTESTEKDKTLVTDEDFESFCQKKADSLSNQVGLIATHLKYLLSQMADSLRLNDEDAKAVIASIVAAAIAMGNDIDEFKHGKALLDMVLFQLELWDGKLETLRSPYFNRYAKKYTSEEDFNKAIFNKDGTEKTPDGGVLNRFSVITERLMTKAGIPFQKEVSKASDGKDRWYYTVHPVKWEKKDVDLYTSEKGEGNILFPLPAELEAVYGVEPGTLFSAKSLFALLYRDHSASCKDLLGSEDDRDQFVKSLVKINERYGLAKLAVVAWTQAMKKAKEGVDLDAAEALKVFTTLMVQHTKNARSIIEVAVETGTFRRTDGSMYEKTVFDAERKFNYFLDLCGDGLFMLAQHKPNFPAVSETILEAAKAKNPDMDEAWNRVFEECDLLDAILDRFHTSGVEAAVELINDNYIPEEPAGDGWFICPDDLPDDIPEEYV